MVLAMKLDLSFSTNSGTFFFYYEFFSIFKFFLVFFSCEEIHEQIFLTNF